MHASTARTASARPIVRRFCAPASGERPEARPPLLCSVLTDGCAAVAMIAPDSRLLRRDGLARQRYVLHGFQRDPFAVLVFAADPGVSTEAEIFGVVQAVDVAWHEEARAFPRLDLFFEGGRGELRRADRVRPLGDCEEIGEDRVIREFADPLRLAVHFHRRPEDLRRFALDERVFDVAAGYPASWPAVGFGGLGERRSVAAVGRDHRHFY